MASVLLKYQYGIDRTLTSICVRSGHYIEAEMDGGVGRDVMEFLVKKDAGVVAYRCMATKVTFVYPFTTAVGDSKGQKQRIAAISQELGWYAPDIQSSMDSDDVNYVP
jgi:hypothetical protein